MDEDTIKSDTFLGRSPITWEEGGSVDIASEAMVSIMRLIHNICVTVNGISIPIKAHIADTMRAARQMVNWKAIKRWIFL